MDIKDLPKEFNFQVSRSLVNKIYHAKLIHDIWGERYEIFNDMGILVTEISEHQMLSSITNGDYIITLTIPIPNALLYRKQKKG